MTKRRLSDSDLPVFFDEIVSRALAELSARSVDVHTFAFYHDHESAAVSICVDTKANSEVVQERQNEYALRQFGEAIDAGDLKLARLWKTDQDRSYSLGDFAEVNLCRVDLPRVAIDGNFYLAMIRTLMRRRGEIATLSSCPSNLMFCSSGANDEVEFLWRFDPND